MLTMGLTTVARLSSIRLARVLSSIRLVILCVAYSTALGAAHVAVVDFRFGALE
jgi:hypothetical protein